MAPSSREYQCANGDERKSRGASVFSISVKNFWQICQLSACLVAYVRGCRSAENERQKNQRIAGIGDSQDGPLAADRITQNFLLMHLRRGAHSCRLTKHPLTRRPLSDSQAVSGGLENLLLPHCMRQSLHRRFSGSAERYDLSHVGGLRLNLPVALRFFR
jgi:hypothetical protein